MPLDIDDCEQIFLLLGFLYAVESAWWLRGPACRIYATPFEAWSDDPLRPPTADAWRLGFSNPLPGFESYTSEPFPFKFDFRQVLIESTNPTTGQQELEALAFDEVPGFFAEQKSVVAGDRIIGTFSTERFADIVAERLERIRCCSATARETIARQVLAEMWDIDAARIQVASCRRAVFSIRQCGAGLSVLALVVSPIAWQARAWLPLGTMFCVLLACVLAWCAVIALLPRLRTGDQPIDAMPVMSRVLSLLSPVTAMRLHDLLSRDILTGFEPLVVAIVTTNRPRSRLLAEAHARAVLFPLCVSVVPVRPEWDEVMAWHSNHTRELACRALADIGMTCDDLLTFHPETADARSQCPRCMRQFQQASGSCAFCGLLLRSVASGPTETTASVNETMHH